MGKAPHEQGAFLGGSPTHPLSTPTSPHGPGFHPETQRRAGRRERVRQPPAGSSGPSPRPLSTQYLAPGDASQTPYFGA